MCIITREIADQSEGSITQADQSEDSITQTDKSVSSASANSKSDPDHEDNSTCVCPDLDLERERKRERERERGRLCAPHLPGARLGACVLLCNISREQVLKGLTWVNSDEDIYDENRLEVLVNTLS